MSCGGRTCLGEEADDVGGLEERKGRGCSSLFVVGVSEEDYGE
jgi:hypothetical protein